MLGGNVETSRQTPRGVVLSGEELPELLSDLAEAPDFPAAGNRLLEQFGEAAGSGRAVVYVLDRFSHHLELTCHVGCRDAELQQRSVPLDAIGHPLVVSARGQSVVMVKEAAAKRMGLPFGCACLLPLPQPFTRGLPTLRQDEPIFDPLYDGCEVFPWSGENRRRLGHAPFGVVVIDGRPDTAVIESLAGAALLAGPILSRTHMADRLKRSAERLDEQRSLLTAIINALPDPIVITDAMNNVIVQNQRAEILLAPQDSDSEGRRRAVEINNLLFSSFVSKAVMTGGVRPTARELNLVDPDEGTDLLFEVLAHPLPPSIAREGAHVSVLRDVTDLKRASIELERQYQRARLTEMDATRERDRLNLILNNVADPILVTDHQSKIILMNPLAELLFELPEGTHDLQRVQRVRGNDTKFTTLISDFAISAATYRRERITLVQPELGVEVPMEVVAGKVMNERGEPLAIVCVLHDLTTQVENERLYNELKKFSGELEDRIRLATADLEAQNMRLQWQSSELEKAYRLKSEFLANMSHELRTPINALIGYTALMLDRIYGELTAKQVEGLNRIQVSSQHLLALINDILDLAKIEAGKMPIHLEPAPLRAIIAEVASQMEPLIKRKSLEFVSDIPDDLPLMITDRTKVKQIVLNLLSNAVKFTHRGSIVLSARPEGGAVEITVKDTGIGIK
ncbi:MAG TPA: histidine kinase dimerization/phospho-acceptor domain-containing protein, partial [Gemmatimonadaceae bacterium]|nr:histidine kinase dimerization/phospho-acceptor domain-containing protein [Gemmatimonadaceae bacterium]